MEQQVGKAQVYEADDVVREIMRRQDELEQLTEEVKGRRAAAGGGAAAAQAELEAATASAFALQVEMQKCIDDERYEDAATKRDMLQVVQAKAGKAKATLGEWGVGEGAAVSYRYAVGQCVAHADGWTGVVCGMDASCCEGEGWREAHGAGFAERGENQPFYHVLPDVAECPLIVDGNQCYVAYVAEERLSAPEPPATWVEVHGRDKVVAHPFLDRLFYGADGEGNWVPSKALRNKYKLDRKDVYVPGAEIEYEGEDIDPNIPPEEL